MEIHGIEKIREKNNRATRIAGGGAGRFCGDKTKKGVSSNLARRKKKKMLSCACRYLQAT